MGIKKKIWILDKIETKLNRKKVFVCEEINWFSKSFLYQVWTEKDFSFLCLEFYAIPKIFFFNKNEPGPSLNWLLLGDFVPPSPKRHSLLGDIIYNNLQSWTWWNRAPPRVPLSVSSKLKVFLGWKTRRLCKKIVHKLFSVFIPHLIKTLHYKFIYMCNI